MNLNRRADDIEILAQHVRRRSRGAIYTAATKTVRLTTAANLVPSVTPHVLSMTGIRNSQARRWSGTQTISFIGGISTIVFVQTPKSATNDSSQVVNQQVTFRGVVTEQTAGATPDFPTSIGGFYVQQRGATAYGGIFVFGPPATPAKGDSVLVSGVVSEFGVGPETEIVSVDEVTVLGSNRPAITPPVVTLANASGLEPSRGREVRGHADQDRELSARLHRPRPGGVPHLAEVGRSRHAPRRQLRGQRSGCTRHGAAIRATST